MPDTYKRGDNEQHEYEDHWRAETFDDDERDQDERQRESAQRRSGLARVRTGLQADAIAGKGHQK